MSGKEAHVDASRFLALVLRHRPQEAGISLDEHGWANVDQLVAGIASKRTFSREILEEIVATDSKGRYSFNDDHTLIRANQGHSINVDVELEQVPPPETLYHGTGQKYVESIMENGLVPKSRLYVHLSTDYDTAMKVGSRHGSPIVFKVDALRMFDDGHEFFLSKNGFWLTRRVSSEYLQIVES